ncbi:MAG: YraN family protein [Lachnospiraceae bacterium]|nr:YraN family protein [Lachnospiraceae bacterium]
MPWNNREIGSKYEDLAAEYLISKGYRILDRNFRRRGGELDIVALEDGVLVICEVKYRRSETAGDPLEAVGYRKQLQISKMTALYLSSHGYPLDSEIRFDVIGITGSGKVKHIENAFYYCYG